MKRSASSKRSVFFEPIPLQDRGGTTGFEDRERERCECGKVSLLKSFADGRDGGRWNQVQEQQSATTPGAPA